MTPTIRRLARRARVPALVLLACGCVPAYYPPPVNVPLFSDEGEVSVTAYGGTDGFGAQVAAAPIEHLTLMANTSLNTDYFYHYYGDFGAGYFLPFGIGRFEVDAGFGGGTARGNDPHCGSLARPTPCPVGILPGLATERAGTYIRGWAQSFVGLSMRIFEGAIGSRVSYVQYKWQPDAFRDSTSDGLYVEPTGVIRVGYEFIKGEYQFGLSLPVANTAGRLPPSLGWHMTFGVRFVLDFWGEDEVHTPWSDDVDDDDDDDDDVDDEDAERRYEGEYQDPGSAGRYDEAPLVPTTSEPASAPRTYGPAPEGGAAEVHDLSSGDHTGHDHAGHDHPHPDPAAGPPAGGAPAEPGASPEGAATPTTEEAALPEPSEPAPDDPAAGAAEPEAPAAEAEPEPPAKGKGKRKGRKGKGKRKRR